MPAEGQRAGAPSRECGRGLMGGVAQAATAPRTRASLSVNDPGPERLPPPATASSWLWVRLGVPEGTLPDADIVIVAFLRLTELK